MLVAASAYAANPTSIGRDLQMAVNAGADWLNFEIMDGLPDISFGPSVISHMRAKVRTPMSAEVLARNNPQLINRLSQTGVSRIILYESPIAAKAVREYGTELGWAIPPTQQLDMVPNEVVSIAQHYLVLFHHAGTFGTPPPTEFVTNALRKISDIKSQTKCTVSVRGNINAELARQARDAGADMVIVGEYLFGSGSARIKKRMQSLKHA